MLKLIDNVCQNMVAFLSRSIESIGLFAILTVVFKTTNVRLRGIRFYNDFANDFATCRA